MNLRRKSKVHNILNGQKCEMHNYLTKHMTFLRLAGIFPVEGLGKPNVQNLRFKLKSFYGVYYFASFFGQAALTALSATWCFTPENYSSSSITNLIYYITALLVMIITLELAQRWPILLRKVAKLESQLREIRRNNNVKKHCDYLLLFVIIICLVEHLLSLSFFYKTLWNCNVSQKFTDNLFEYYCAHIAPFLFKYTSYAPWKMIIYKYINFQALVLWGVTEVLPMCTSLYLLSYFRDLNNAIETRTNHGPKFWEQHRMHYTRLESLVTLIDEHFKSIVLFSFFNYLYFITVQLFYLFNSHTMHFAKCDISATSLERLYYYIFSVACLISRALTMSLLAANVHVEAQKPLFLLHDITKEEENKEIKRFRLQLVYNPISLTGSFFSLTRCSILKFLSTIVTYELVLLQLNKNRRTNDFLMGLFNYTIQDDTLQN